MKTSGASGKRFRPAEPILKQAECPEQCQGKMLCRPGIIRSAAEFFRFG
jgi:hypothetical protein